MMEHPEKTMLEELARKELAGELLTEKEAECKRHVMECKECRAYSGVYGALIDIIDGEIFGEYMKARVIDQRIILKEPDKWKGADGRSEV